MFILIDIFKFLPLPKDIFENVSQRLHSKYKNGCSSSLSGKPLNACSVGTGNYQEFQNSDVKINCNEIRLARIVTWSETAHPFHPMLWIFASGTLLDAFPYQTMKSRRHQHHLLKGTVSRDFSSPVFLTKQLLLVPMGMPRNDFDFLKIFFEIFVFIIDSLVMNTPGNQLESLK
jgi:hypothetical protein